MDTNTGIQSVPTSRPSAAEESALCDFLLMLRSDESGGIHRPIGEYLSRFPGLELRIAREYIAHLDRHAEAPVRGPAARYQPGAIIGRGGMGEVRRARDVQLGRELAMKTLRRRGARARQRFLREASITGRLDHPGVVPVHDMGVDDAGRPYFTMKHVEGIDLDEVFAKVHQRDPAWSMTRALEVMIKVCDTVAFAHSRGVVHRDLKPSNVRVGRFGEVYVMDWGLARATTEAPLAVELVDGDGEDEEEDARPSAADAPGLTLEGDVLGTPAYMAPEQAGGRNDSVDETADVYSVGAMLYQLLSGCRPYGSDGRRRSQDEVLQLVRTSAPTDVRVLNRRAPGELVAICEKAMRRDPLQRYARMEAVAGDLRAFLERRVVSAHDTRPLRRALKWARRNLAVVVPAAVVLLAAVVGAVLVRETRREGRQRLLQLSRSQLVAAFDTLWPPQPSNRRALERWLADAEEVLATRAQDLLELAKLRLAALPMDPEAPAERAERTRLNLRVQQRRSLIRYFENTLEQIDRGVRGPPDGMTRAWVAAQVAINREHLARESLARPEHLTFRFPDDDDQVLFEALTLLVSEQDKILGLDRPFGLLDLARWGLAAERRLDGPLPEPFPPTSWEVARRSIANRDECPLYEGLDLSPQLGLVPLGRDPRSGLWEFAHVLSGDVPGRNSDGSLAIDECSCIVLVLAPGGTLLRGSQRDNPFAPNFDPWSEANAPREGEVELQPFFLSKFELTKAQWERVAVRDAEAGKEELGRALVPLQPLAGVSFEDARRFLAVLGLVLPTEAQWECAQRSGTDTPWSCGSAPESIIGHANIAGSVIVRDEYIYPNDSGLPTGYEDGFPVRSPVGSFLPNAFGLHDMMGNVREWTRDTGPFEYHHNETRIETGERLFHDDGTRAVRGGSYAQSALSCRSAAREQVGPLLRSSDLGIRPAREIDR